jgi:hypothetical protein
VAIWDQLNTKTIKDIASTEIQKQTGAIHLEEHNRAALQDTVLINRATQRDGQPIADSGEIKVYVQSTNDTQAVIRPPAGQVWEIIGISINNSSGLSSSQTYYFYYSSPATIAASSVPAASTDMLVSSITSSSTNQAWETLSEDSVPRRVIATNQVFPRLYGNFTGVGVGESINWIVAYTQIR